MPPCACAAWQAQLASCRLQESLSPPAANVAAAVGGDDGDNGEGHGDGDDDDGSGGGDDAHAAKKRAMRQARGASLTQGL